MHWQMLRRLSQAFTLCFIFNPALSFDLHIHLDSGSFWFYLFILVPNLSPFPTLSMLLSKPFQPFTLIITATFSSDFYSNNPHSLRFT